MSRIKSLVLGVFVIILIGIGGLVYRNAVEHPNREIMCPLDSRVCPDGTSVARTGTTCTFGVCAPPNVSLEAAGIAYVVPEGFIASDTPDEAALVAYIGAPTVEASTTIPNMIVIRSYAIGASSTPASTIEKTAIGGASGEPVPQRLYSSTSVSGRTFVVVPIERFEGVVVTAYYLKRGNSMLRFDAIDHGTDWTNPNLVIASLPAHAALMKLLGTLQAQ